MYIECFHIIKYQNVKNACNASYMSKRKDITRNVSFECFFEHGGHENAEKHVNHPI